MWQSHGRFVLTYFPSLDFLIETGSNLMSAVMGRQSCPSLLMITLLTSLGTTQFLVRFNAVFFAEVLASMI